MVKPFCSHALLFKCLCTVALSVSDLTLDASMFIPFGSFSAMSLIDCHSCIIYEMAYPKKWFAGVKPLPILILSISLFGFFFSWFLGFCKCVGFESSAFVKFFLSTVFFSASYPFCTYLGFPTKLWQCPCSSLTVSCDYRVSAGLLLQPGSAS